MKEFRKSYFRESDSVADFRAGSFSVWCYRGNVATPKWKDVDTSEGHFTIICLTFFFCPWWTKKKFADNYTKLCTIEADLSRVPLFPRPKATGKGSFYRVDYEIVLLFGMTELKALIAWKEKVSGPHMSYIGLIFYAWFFRELRNGKF